MAYITDSNRIPKKVIQGVKVEYIPAVYQTKKITPSNQRNIITADSGYAALNKVILDGVLVDAHQSYAPETDSTIAYQKLVPLGALKIASLDKLGGMSYKSLNVWDEEWELGDISGSGQNIVSNTTIRSKGFISVLPNITYYFKTPKTISYLYFDSAQNVIGSWNNINNNTFTTPNNCFYVRFVINNQTTYNHDICINVSNASINGKYYPYFEGIHDSAVTEVGVLGYLGRLTIPSQIQALTGYGWGINANCYNYIDFSLNEFRQYVGRVDLGTLDWSYYSSGQYFYLTFSNAKAPANNNVLGNILCAKYENVTGSAFPINNTITLNMQGQLEIKDTTYTTVTAFKQAMSGVYLYYELATPVIIDVSSYVETNKTNCYSNHNETFVNTYNQAVPSEITYLVEVSNG